jgi:DNA repair protein RadD
VRIDANGVRHSGKEYIAGELEKHVLDSGTTPAAVADMIERAKDRKKWLVFSCGVKHAMEIKGLLESHGIAAGIITGDTPKIERDSLIDDFKGRTLHQIRALVNVNVLTTGFNVPSVDFIALMRPTESVGLYVQMVGRGMRMSPGKTDCLIADYAGLTLRHGPIDAVDPSRTPFDGDGVAPAKECPDCQTIIHAAIRICPVCGHEFPKTEIQIKTTPTEAPILKAQIEPEGKGP